MSDIIVRKIKKVLEQTLVDPCPIYTHVPEKAAYPYITLELQKTYPGFHNRLQGEVQCLYWTRSPTLHHASSWGDQITTALNGDHVCEEEGELYCRLQDTHIRLLRDGKTRQTVTNFRVSWKGVSHERD